MNNEETLNPNFNINAKYEDMIERAKHNIDLYLKTGKDCSDISLSYDVKNYLPLALKEIDRLNNIINELNECYIKVINKCNWIVDHRDYMTEIAIKKSAEEIKNICKYYVKAEWYDAEELKEGK